MTYKMPKSVEERQRKALEKNKGKLTPREKKAAEAILEKAKAERESDIKKPASVKASVKAGEKAEKLSKPEGFRESSIKKTKRID